MNWDDIDLGIGKNETTQQWDEMDLNKKSAIDVLMNIGKDPKNYTQDDELYLENEEATRRRRNPEKPKYKRRGDMSTWEKLTHILDDPEVEVINGKRYKMNNKELNDMDNRQVQEYLGQNLIPSDDPNDEHFYMFEVPEADGSTSIKMGKAAKSWYERYKDQPEVLSRANVLYDQPIKNADEIEKMIHGSKWARDNRRADFGKAQVYGDGGTEYYDYDSLLFGKQHTGTPQTEVQKKAMSSVEKLFTPEQVKLAQEVRTKTSPKKQTKVTNKTTPKDNSDNVLKNMDVYSKEFASLSPENTIKALQEKNKEIGEYSPHGGIDEEQLARLPQYSSLYDTLAGSIFPAKSGLTPEQKGNELNKELSRINWDVMSLGKGVFESLNDPSKAKALADALEMYQSTSVSPRQVGGAVEALFTDPTTYFTLGGSGIAKGVGKKEATKSIVKKLREKAMQGLQAPITQSAAAGSAYGTLDDTLRQVNSINAGDQKEMDLTRSAIAAIAGGALGGALHGTMAGVFEKVPEKERVVAQQRIEEAPTQEAKEEVAKEIVKEFREKGYMEIYKDNVEKGHPDFNKPEGKDITETIPGTPGKEAPEEIVKPTNEKYVKDKSGKIQKGEEYVNNVREVERTRMDIRDPRANPGDKLPDQNVPNVPREKKTMKVEPDNRGRNYEKNGELLSHTGTTSQKAQIEVNEIPTIKKPEDVAKQLNEIHRIEYKKNEVRRAYGGEQSSYKGEDRIQHLSDKQIEANVIDKQEEFLKSQLKNNKDLDDKTRVTITKALNELDAKKPTQFPLSKNKMKIAEKKLIKSRLERTRRNTTRLEHDDARAKEMSKIKEREPEAFNHSPYGKLSDEEKHVAHENIIKTIRKRTKQDEKAAIKAYDEIEKRELRKGRKWDGTIDHDIRRQYRNKATILDDYRNRLNDLNDELTDEQLIHNETQRLDKKYSSMGERKFNNVEEENELLKKIKQEYADIYVKRKPTRLKDLKVQGREIDSISSNVDVEKKTPEDIAKEEKRKKFMESDKGQELAERKARENYDNEIKAMTKARKHLLKTLERGPNARNRKGQYLRSAEQRRLMKEGILTNEEIVDLTIPLHEFGENKDDALARIKRRVFGRRHEVISKKYGLSKMFTEQQPKELKFHSVMMDASASGTQMIAALMGDADIAKFVKLLDNDVDVRKTIGENIYKETGIDFRELSKKDDQTWKDLVKAPFMTKGYGEMKRGIIRTLRKNHGWDEFTAKKFYEAFERQLDKILPGVNKMMNAIYKLNEDPKFDGIIRYTLPNGFKVNINTQRLFEGKLSINGKEIPMSINAGDRNEFSRALVPHIVHSIDAYIVSKMNGKGVLTNHDMFVKPKEWTKEHLTKEYAQELDNLSQSNVLDDIMRQLGYKGEPLKNNVKNKLNKGDIAKGQHALAVEHSPDIPEFSEVRPRDTSRALTELEIVQDNMSTLDARGVSSSQLLDSLVEEFSFDPDRAIMRENDSPFERVIAMATQQNTFDKTKSIKPPKGAHVGSWYKAQELLFNEARAKLEFHPTRRHQINGTRKYFNEFQEPLGTQSKNVRDIMNQMRERGKKLFEQQNQGTKDRLVVIGKSFDEILDKVQSWSKNKPMTEIEQVAYALVREAGNTTSGKMDANKELVNDNDGIVPTENKLKVPTEFNRYFERQENKTKWAKQFNDLYQLSTFADRDNARIKEHLVRHLRDIIPEELDEQITKSILYTDYEPLYRDDIMNESDAAKFMRQYRETYLKLKNEIDAAAKGLGTNQDKTGYYRNNPRIILREAGMSINDENIVDKLISIRAMQHKDWDFINLHRNDPWFDEVLDIMTNKKKESLKLFAENEDGYIKGWWAESGSNSKRIDEDGNIVWDAEHKRIQGIIPQALDKNKIGRELAELEAAPLKERLNEHVKSYVDKINEELPSKYQRDNYKIKKMQYNEQKLRDLKLKHKLTKEELKEFDWRSEVSIENREKLFKKGMEPNDIDKTLNKIPTFNKTEKKLNARLRGDAQKIQVMRKMISEVTLDWDKIYKNPTKQNLEDARKRRLKINENDIRKVALDITREKLGKTYKATEIIADSVASVRQKDMRKRVYDYIKKENFDELFSDKPKPNMRPLTEEEASNIPYDLKDIIKYVDEGGAKMILGKDEARLINKEASQMAKVADRIWAELITNFKQNVVMRNASSFKNNFLVGITTNTVAGISPKKMTKLYLTANKDYNDLMDLYSKMAKAIATGNTKQQEALTKKMNNNTMFLLEKNGLATNTIDGVKDDGTLIENMLKESILGKSKHVNKVVSNVMMRQNSYVGSKAAGLFTKIDTQSRYAAAMHFIDEGLSYSEAAVKTNGLYADMNTIAPDIIDIMDKRGFMPFMHWFTQSAPGYIRLFKENPKKAIVIFMLGVAIEDIYNNEIEKDPNPSWFNKGGHSFGSFMPFQAMLDYAFSVGYKDWEGLKDTISNVANPDSPVTWTQASFRKFSPYVIPGIYTKTMSKYSDVVGLDKDIEVGSMAKTIMFPNAGRKFSGSRFKMDTRGGVERATDALGLTTPFSPIKQRKK